MSRDRYLRQLVFFLLVALTVVPQAQARMALAPDAFASGFVALPLVSPANFATAIIAKGHDSRLVHGLCAELSTQFGHYPWEHDACGKVPWPILSPPMVAL